MAKREMITPPNNSFKHKENVKEKVREEPRVLDPDAVRENKKSLGRKFADTFLSEDSHSVTSYIFSDVIVPKLIDLMAGTIKQATDMFFYGRNGGGGSKSTSKQRVYTSASYQDFWYGDQRDSGSYSRQPSDITFSSWDTANDVLEEMKAVVEQGGYISIIEYYDIIEQITRFRPSSSWVDDTYGWTDLTHVKPIIVRGGRYILSLPRTVPIKNV